MKLLNVVVENFRGFDKREFEFAEETVIRGKNGKGKSTIAEAVVWCLYGTNIFGKTKADLTLLRTGTTSMSVLTNWQREDGTTVTIERVKPSQGATQVLVNGKKCGPGQIEGLFFMDVNDFLSVFVPGFFSNLEPKDAKASLARYSELTPEEVLEKLLPEHQEVLKGIKFGMGYDSLEIFRKQIAADLKEAQDERLRMEGELKAAEDAVANGAPECPEPIVKPEMVQKMEQARAYVVEAQLKQQNLKQTLDALDAERKRLRETYDEVKVTLMTVTDTCPTCEQLLPADVREATKVKACTHNAQVKVKLEELVEQGNQVNRQTEQLDLSPAQVADEVEKCNRYVANVEKAQEQDRQAKSDYDALVKVYEDAKKKVATCKTDFARQDQFIANLNVQLAAVKTYRFRYVQLHQAKLDALFEKVKIVLFTVTEDGELKDAFKIQWNGKPYQVLSRSEKVRCDIEIGQAISALREKPEPMPVFVDDAEGVEELFGETFAGQVIGAYRFDSDLLVQRRNDALSDLAAEIKQMQSLISGGRTLKQGA